MKIDLKNLSTFHLFTYAPFITGISKPRIENVKKASPSKDYAERSMITAALRHADFPQFRQSQ